MKFILAGILSLLLLPVQSFGAEQKDSVPSGIWRTNYSEFGNELLYIHGYKVVLVWTEIKNGKLKYSTKEGSFINRIGNCCFYYDSKLQAFVYFGTYTDSNFYRYLPDSSYYTYYKVGRNQLTKDEEGAISNPRQDTCMIWQMRKPPIYGYYYCKDPGSQISEPPPGIYDYPAPGMVYKKLKENFYSDGCGNIYYKDKNDEGGEYYKLTMPLNDWDKKDTLKNFIDIPTYTVYTNTPYSKDKKYVYYMVSHADGNYMRILKGADATTFKTLPGDGYLAEDKNRKYRNGSEIENDTRKRKEPVRIPAK